MSPVDPDFLRMFDGDGVSPVEDRLAAPSRLAFSQRRTGQFAGLALGAVALVIAVGVSDRNSSLAALVNRPTVVKLSPFAPPASVLPALAAPVGPPIVETVYVDGPDQSGGRRERVIDQPAREREPDPEPERKPPGPVTKPRSKINHVALVVLPSSDSLSTWPESGSPEAPYMAGELRSQGTLLSGYRSVGRSDLANRIALISGQEPNPDTEAGCPVFTEITTPFKVDDNGLVAGRGCYYPYDDEAKQKWTIADGLSVQGGRTGPAWRAYVGDADKGPGGVAGLSGCRRPQPGSADPATSPTRADGFMTRLDPFLFFRSLEETAGCDATPGSESNDVPLSQLAADVKRDVDGAGTSRMPTFAAVIPTGCDAGIVTDCGTDPTTGKPNPTGLAAVDAFLSREVKPLIESPTYRKDGIVLIVFDRPAKVDGAVGGEPGSGLVGALAVGPFVRKGAESRVPYSHYSTLASIQDLLGLWKIGRARNGIEGKPQLNSFCSDVFEVDPFDPKAPCRTGSPEAS